MNDTQQIKDKIDVVDLLGEYMTLKPAGINYKGLCPFHREKSPSFMVNRERQRWHCFGCSKSGDIFTFIQELEGMEFIEVLKYLADRAGVKLENTRGSEIQGNQKNRLKEICEAATKFYHEFLLRMPASQAAREYLQKRGLTDETIKKWRIGFIPDQWELLTQYLLKKGYGIDDLIAAGLTIKKDGAAPGRGFYDRFRGRIMFPIFDLYGAVVGFTGRVLVETEKSGGKYVNTPETPIYNKSSIVFALNFAKNSIRQQDLIVMVEGQMDVIACHQAGMENVVATSGTAMTELQVHLLKRYSENIALAFDADAAGQNAAKRGREVALSEGMNIKIITIPEGKGKDADECLKQNPDVWFDAVKNAEDYIRWLIQDTFKKHDVKTPQGKDKIATEVLAEIIRIPSPIIQDFWLKELSDRLVIEIAVLREKVKTLHVKESNSFDRMKNTENTEKIAKIVAPLTRHDKLLGRALALLFIEPKVASLFFSLCEEKYIDSSFFLPLYQKLKVRYTTPSIQDFSDITFDQDEESVLFLAQKQLDESQIESFDFLKEIKTLVDEIKGEWIKLRRGILVHQIEMAEKEGRKDELTRLIAEFQNIK